MDDVKATDVPLTVRDDTRTAHVASTSDHDDVAGVERHEVDDLVLLEVELDRVVGPDEGIGVPDGAAVVGDNVRDALGADCDLLHLEELVGGLLGGLCGGW